MNCEKCNTKLIAYFTKSYNNMVIRYKRCPKCDLRYKTVEVRPKGYMKGEYEDENEK